MHGQKKVPESEHAMMTSSAHLPVYEDFSPEIRIETGPSTGTGHSNRKTAPGTAHERQGLAIILDDAGYNLDAVRRVLALPFPVAISILPSTPFAREVAEITRKANHVVMLHLPMEPNGQYLQKHPMGNDFLRSGMERDELERLVLSELEQIPYVEGVNNHMGSRLTSMQQPMAWLMDVLRKRSLFFVDSRTGKDSIAAEEARKAGIAWGERQIFLDHYPQAEDIAAAWEKAIHCYRTLGSCIVIAHPNEETLAFLENRVPKQDQELIVSVTSLLRQEVVE